MLIDETRSLGCWETDRGFPPHLLRSLGSGHFPGRAPDPGLGSSLPGLGRRLSSEARMGSRTTNSPSPVASNRLAEASNSSETMAVYPSRAWYSSQSSALGEWESISK